MYAAIFDRLAGLLAYPREAQTGTLRDLAADLARDWPEAAEALSGLADALADLTTEQLQELFVRTFDLNPVCCLEVGWQLFGDHYDRGRFLADMRSALRQCGVAESTELPDHLSHILQLLGRMPEPQAATFAADFVMPAVEKMYASLQEACDNPYRELLRAIRVVMAALADTARQEVRR
ncbi:MAG TPA: nitrate reductase molybdenum cofactor assembly chaperone [Phycisphaerae bacterium]|nr:nitrate reductase molybdenum cofactor assembly chaperone [Phycisphaerae bacterium]HOJ75092.1 nitrate reductase molybdenum cofactor assembly chaperone [Phycisphaerae bacterium]HOM53477.1 nitrate reductase molybdenum cofactor assembly chaperone [Phycisphaerae bacterium]HON66853.1 nitrate reductase molybdenum cofactor assembly chaperone [Phycisphaerae bacterium]HOQ88307.1 nitrate reductase molybdenum cofactor assembly chaperone [Phycisphaerae bacterium]